MKEVSVPGNPSYEKQGLKRLHSLAKSIPKIDYKESVSKGSSCWQPTAKDFKMIIFFDQSDASNMFQLLTTKYQQTVSQK